MKGLSFEVVGGISSFILFSLMSYLLHASDTAGFIVTGFITLSAIICGCTGILVNTLEKTNRKKSV